MVLEASLGYTASCSVVLMDEIATVDERVDGEIDGLKNRICQSPYFIHTLFTLLVSPLAKSSHSHLLYLICTLVTLLFSPAQHSVIMLIPSLPSFLFTTSRISHVQQ